MPLGRWANIEVGLVPKDRWAHRGQPLKNHGCRPTTRKTLLGYTLGTQVETLAYIGYPKNLFGIPTRRKVEHKRSYVPYQCSLPQGSLGMSRKQPWSCTSVRGITHWLHAAKRHITTLVEQWYCLSAPSTCSDLHTWTPRHVAAGGSARHPQNTIPSPTSPNQLDLQEKPEVEPPNAMGPKGAEKGQPI